MHRLGDAGGGIHRLSDTSEHVQRIYKSAKHWVWSYWGRLFLFVDIAVSSKTNLPLTI